MHDFIPVCQIIHMVSNFYENEYACFRFSSFNYLSINNVSVFIKIYRINLI